MDPNGHSRDLNRRIWKGHLLQLPLSDTKDLKASHLWLGTLLLESVVGKGYICKVTVLSKRFAWISAKFSPMQGVRLIPILKSIWTEQKSIQTNCLLITPKVGVCGRRSTSNKSCLCASLQCGDFLRRCGGDPGRERSWHSRYYNMRTMQCGSMAWASWRIFPLVLSFDVHVSSRLFSSSKGNLHFGQSEAT